MSPLLLRVVARFLQADEEAKKPGKGGVPARWQEFLDKVHHGGKEKVKNPNPKTQGRFSDVSYSTALHYPKFFLEALKEYKEWAKKNKEKGEKGNQDSSGPKTPLPDSVPKEETKRIFGDGPPSMEDFEEMFSAGEGYKTKIKDVKFRKDASDDDNDLVKNSIEVTAEIHDKDGKFVGKAIRNFYSKDGKPGVLNQEIKLEPDAQGKGIGKSILANGIKGYLKRGIKNVSLDAAWVGRYTWARMGFDADPKTFNSMKLDFRKHLMNEVGLDRDKAQKVLDSVKNMRDMSSVKIDGEHAGKDFLLSKKAQVWSGELSLEEDNPGFKTAKEYLGL